MTSYTNDDNFKIRTTIGEITLLYNYMNITVANKMLITTILQNNCVHATFDIMITYFKINS